MSTDGVSAAELRIQILDAAAEEFMQHGYGQTTINDIAQRLGATKGLVYYHYASKFDLFLAIYEHSMKDTLNTLRSLSVTPGTGGEKLWAMSVAHVTRIMSGMRYHYVVQQGVRDARSLSLKTKQREALRDLNRLRDDYEHLFRNVLATGVDDRSIRQVDVTLATRVLLSSLNAVDDWYRPHDYDSDESRRELAGKIADLVLGGLYG